MLKLLFLVFDRRIASALKMELEELLNSLGLQGDIIVADGFSSCGLFYALFLETSLLSFDEEKYRRFIKEAKRLKKLYL